MSKLLLVSCSALVDSAHSGTGLADLCTIEPEKWTP